MARLGEIIDGKYEILREIGRGGMSVVYLAMDKRLNKQWAIKEFRKDKDDENKQIALKSLLREANIMKRLSHPSLPRIVDVIENTDTVYVIMDYIEGESLDKILDASGAQPQEAVVEWAKQLSAVLGYLHNQDPPVIYRDMKPANVMLRPDGSVCLIDFGIAREYKAGKSSDTEIIGTRGYAAPEQFGDKGQTDARTDIYSLGVTLYHLLTGQNPAEPPYEIYPIRHWNPALSSGLEWLVQKCTQLNPKDRYQSCAEITYVLENLDKFDVEYKRKERRKLNAFIAAAVLAVVFGVASAGSFFGRAATINSSYQENLGRGNYVEAIEIDRNRPEAYVALAKYLREKVKEVKYDEDKKTSNNTPAEGETITPGDLLAWFPTDTMDALEKNYPKQFAKIQFDLGYLMWDKYRGDSDNKNNDAGSNDPAVFKETVSHFEKVLRVAADNESVVLTDSEISENEENSWEGGISKKNLNMAKALYAISFLQYNNEYLRENDAGDVKNIDELQKYAGINVEAYKKSPYCAFWITIKDVLTKIQSNELEMSSSFKIVTLDRLIYSFETNSSDFFSSYAWTDCTQTDNDQNVDTSEHDIKKEKAELNSFVALFDKVLPLPDLKNGYGTEEKKINKIRTNVNSTMEYLEGLYSDLKNDEGSLNRLEVIEGGN